MMFLPILRARTDHLDEFVVLEAVADDRRVVAVGDGQHGQQFRLGAGFQAEVERLAEIENLLDDVPLLVHLDRIDAAVVALVLEFARWRLEGLGDLADAMAQDVGEANEDRQLIIAVAQFVDELLEVDRFFGRLVGVNGDVAELVDAEVAFAPVADAVGFDGIDDLPVAQRFGIGRSTLQGLRHQKNLRAMEQRTRT